MIKPIVFLTGLALAVQAYAATTINAVNRSACAANLGWINVGSGAPANGIQYQNNSASDYGVNYDGRGNLRGCAYGASIGWLNFENTGAPRLDPMTGKLSGYIYSANCGWISLSNALGRVQPDFVSA